MDNEQMEVHIDVADLLWKLRMEDSTQYFTLVKMHLSFATDLSTDQCDGSLDNVSLPVSKWNLTPLKKKFARSNNSGKNFADNAPLSEEAVFQAFQLIQFLKREENISQEGLFRKTGSISRQQELRALFNAGENLNLESGMFSPHDCASVLKIFLSDLPEPLLQEGHYHVHCRIADMCSQHLDAEQQSATFARKIKALRLVFLLLPKLNYNLLKNLLILLNCVSTHQKENRMTSSNLGTMFAPHILCPRKMTANDLQNLSGSLSAAVAFMIENAPMLFQVPLELEIDVRQYWNNKNNHTTSKTSLQEAPTKTIFTFIDRELTAQANDKDVTEMALAELYAYVQAMPDSVKKRKLIKQFNGASGQGTPTLNSSSKKEHKVKIFGSSIKRHLFAKPTKSSKCKTQNMKNENSTSAVCCSPELKLFRRTMTVIKSTKDFAIDSQQHSTPCSGNNTRAVSTPNGICNINDSQQNLSYQDLQTSLSAVQRRLNESLTSSVINSSYVTPINSNISQQTLESSVKPLNKSYEFPANYIYSKSRRRSSPLLRVATPKVFEESFDGKNLSNLTEIEENTVQENSPITRALMKSNVEQKIIMTPRSRLPIIMNSSSNLLGVPIQEENETKSAEEFSKSCLRNSITYLHEGTSPVKSNLNNPDENTNALEEPPELDGKRVMKHSTSSSSSLFGNFFKHLSTTSLAQLASRLTSTSSSPSSTPTSPCLESSQGDDNTLDESHTEFNETLSNVFKDYLLSRSILTDNPVDLSTDTFGEDIFEENSDSAYGGSLPLSKQTSRQCSKTSLDSISADDSNSNPISDSMLYCLDGNNPFNVSYSKENQPEDFISNKKAKNSPLSLDVHHLKFKRGEKDVSGQDSNCVNDINCPIEVDLPHCNKPCHSRLSSQEYSEQNLHSCTPEGRSKSHFKNKNGTPVPHRDLESRHNSADRVKSILFETSF